MDEHSLPMRHFQDFMPSRTNHAFIAGEARPRGPDPHVAIARRAIVDEHRAVFGYELFEREHAAANDDAMLFDALSDAGGAGLAGRKTVFVRCTFENMADGYLEALDADRVVLEIPTLHRYTEEGMTVRRGMLVKARQAGFQLAFDQSVLHPAYASWLALASFVRIDLAPSDGHDVEQLVRTVRALSGAIVVAGRIEDAGQYERMKGLGVKLFKGGWLTAPSAASIDRSAQASQITVLQLLEQLRNDSDLDQIEEVLKKDPMLSFMLLRFINSSSFGLSTEVTSFRHAVMILGIKKLFRWAALLMTTSRAGGAAPAAGTSAVVRGRLMELLAAELVPPDQCELAFLTGVFSRLDVLLGMPMEAALAEVNLPKSIVDALLRNQGPWAPLLDLTKACESGDERAFAKAASQLSLTNHQINSAHLQALIWADQLEQ